MSYAEELGSEVRNLEKSISGRIYAGTGRHVSGSSIGT